MSKGKRRREKLVLSQGDVAYLDGLFDPYDDLPDGAWQAACEDAVRDCSRFRGKEPYDVWIAWVAVTSEKTE